eukprot:167187-Pleurochrysis_carterae.AAC.2
METRALQPCGKTNAKGVPTVACGLRRGQAVKEQGGKEARRLSASEGVSGLALSAVRREPTHAHLPRRERPARSERALLPCCPAHRRRQEQSACRPRPRLSHRICLARISHLSPVERL